MDPRLARVPVDPRTATPPQPPPPPPPPTEAPPNHQTGGESVGLDETNGQKPGTPAEEGGFKLKFCTVCASNNNR